MKKPTIRDVARLAEVSLSTASLAFNQPERVAEQTRNRILETAESISFTPNTLAKRFALNSSQTIAVCAFTSSSEDTSGSFFFPILRSIAEVAREHSHSLHLFIGDLMDPIEKQKAAIEEFFDKRLAEGILVYCFQTPTAELFSGASRVGFPFVLMNNHMEDFKEHCVAVDNRDGIRQAVEYLKKLGHRKIAFIEGPGFQQDAVERRESFYESSKAAGLPIDEKLIYAGDYFIESGYEAMEYFCRNDSHPAAVIASNDSMAIGVYKYCRARNLRIPQDVSVIGFDDIEMAAHLDPPLTTLKQPFSLLGKTSTELLFDHIDGKKTVGAIEKLKTELIIRESCTTVGSSISQNK